MAELGIDPEGEYASDDTLQRIRRNSTDDLATSTGYLGIFGDPVAQAVWDFGRSFVNRSEVRKQIHEGDIGCLADALLAWTLQGDGAKHCPNYESFLLACIHIIALWNGEQGQRYDGSWSPVRTAELDPDYLTALEHQQSGLRDDYVPVVLPTLVRSSDISEVEIWNHPVFQRPTFEFAQHQLRTGVWHHD